MYEYACKICGMPLTARTKLEIRQFCGKKCYGAFLHQKRESQFAEERPQNRDIHPDGYNNLVCAIVKQARDDVLNFGPESYIRQDAEDFFLSDYFERLTNLDGFEVLYSLSQQYEERQQKKGVKGHERTGNA